jgi:hypothetical protein
MNLHFWGQISGTIFPQPTTVLSSLYFHLTMSKPRGKQTFNLPRGDANQFTHIKRFLITDANYKLVSNKPIWEDAYKTPEQRTRASKCQKWFLEGVPDDSGRNLRILEINLQFDRYNIKHRMNESGIITDGHTATHMHLTQSMQNPF